MKRLVLSLIAALIAAGAAASVLKSNALFPFNKSGMPPIRELQTADGLGKLPIQDFEDRSLVFPRESKE
jgi:hypothetical protein